MDRKVEKNLYLYDPRTNILSETTYSQIEEISGVKIRTLRSYKSAGKKNIKINCYLVDDSITARQRKDWYEKEKYHNEVWKGIHGSDGKFFVSNYGRFKRVYKNHEGFLLPFLQKRNGYLRIKVKFNGVYKDHKVANIVAAHFVGKPKPGQVLIHKNLIKTDDYFANLEFISKEELGKRTGQLAKSKPVIQLNLETHEVINEFRSAREAGRQCYLSYQAVLDNCNHKTKSSGGYVFMFEEEYEKLYPMEEEQWI